MWRCVSRLEEKGSTCTSPTIKEEVLQQAVMDAINQMLFNKEDFLSTLQDNIARVLNEKDDQTADDITAKLKNLQNELLRLANSKADYEEVAEEIYRLRELKQNTLIANAECEGKKQRMDEMREFLYEQPYELEEYNEQLVRNLVEKVTVHGDKISIEFKSGVEVAVEM